MADPARAMKVADRIKTVVAENLAIVIKDPDLGFVTITDVRVTGDLQNASIFYTVFGDERQQTRTAALLSANKGRLRSVVGRELGIRLTPTIEFFPDALPETSSHLEDLLKAAKERDAQVAATAQGAHYAGEADPYRRPHDEDAQDSDADSDTAVADPA
ncbi:MAG: 30S ribosome-binding factor RbfA [Phycicoccus sp.]|nr:30S ribosome-binding factor RbfA [Phycicoccus sp.]